MQTPADMYAEELAELDALAAELTARGYNTAVQTPAGRLPYLAVINPRARALSERILAQAGKFWWPWAEPIASCDDVADAAATVAKVLRAVGE